MYLEKQKDLVFVQYAPHHNEADKKAALWTVRKHSARVSHSRDSLKLKWLPKAPLHRASRSKRTVSFAKPQIVKPDSVPYLDTLLEQRQRRETLRRRKGLHKPRTPKQKEPDRCRKDVSVPNTAVDTSAELSPSTNLAVVWNSVCMSNVDIHAEGFPGLRLDPFRCIEQMDNEPGNAFIIDWYIQHFGTKNDVASYVFNITNFYASVLSIFTDDAFFHAGICIIWNMYGQMRKPGSKPSPEVWKHRGIAMSKVRARMDSPATDLVEDRTIYSIIFLCFLEASLGNLNAHRLHKRCLASIIANRGGLDKLPNGSLVKACLLQFDTTWTLETGESVAETNISTPEEKKEIEFDTSDISGLPQAFQQLHCQLGLSRSTLEIIHRAHALTNLGSRARNDFLTVTRRSPGKYNDFREASMCIDRSDDERYPEFEKLLQLAIVVYCYTAFGLRDSTSPLRTMRLDLGKRIRRYHIRSAIEQDAFTWIWLLAINAWAIRGVLQLEGYSLKTDFLTRQDRIRDSADAIEMGSKFLWTPDLSSSIRRYWDRRI